MLFSEILGILTSMFLYPPAALPTLPVSNLQTCTCNFNYRQSTKERKSLIIKVLLKLRSTDGHTGIGKLTLNSISGITVLLK